jgi:hypothetical protein
MGLLFIHLSYNKRINFVQPYELRSALLHRERFGSENRPCPLADALCDPCSAILAVTHTCCNGVTANSAPPFVSTDLYNRDIKRSDNLASSEQQVRQDVLVGL